MYNQKNQQTYSTYFKAAFATVFTISSFVLAKSTGYLFGSSDAGKENKVDDTNIVQNSLGLRRSIEQTTNRIINQEVLQSLQLINSTPAGSFNVSGIQDMVIKNNIAYIAAGDNGFQVMDVSNISIPIITGRYQLTGGFAHQLNLMGNYAYIAYDLLGLRIIDITNPYNISLAGVYMAGEIPTREPVVKVAVAGNRALVITDLEKGQFEWVDISQPTQIFRVYIDTPGYPYSVSVVGGVAYVADYGGLQLINVSNPANPSLLSRFNLTGRTAYDVSLVGDVAYVADFDAGLQLINVSNPSNLSLLSSVNTPGDAYSVSVIGGIAYVADGISGLQLINVSNPRNLSLLGSFNTPGYAYGVSVIGSIAYVADYNAGLQLINVSNPRNLSLLSTFNTSGRANSVRVIGGVAYVAEGDNLLFSGLQLINVSNPRNPSLLSSFNTSGLANSVSVVGGVAYVACRDSLQLINVSNPRNPSLLGSFKTADAQAVSVVGGIVYVADYGAGLQIFDTSRGFFSYLRADILEIKNKFINDVCVLGNTFFYTEQDRGLVLEDDPNYIVGAIDIGGFGISVVGSIAYVIEINGLKLINVSNPKNPSLLGRFNGTQYNKDLSVVGDIVYLLSPASLLLINVSNPKNPSLLGSYTRMQYAMDVSVVGSVAYVTDYPDTSNFARLQLINVSNPANPSLLSSFNTPGDAYGISVVGSIAYVADGSAGLQLINVSNPRNPSLLGSFNTVGSTHDVSVVGGVACVADFYVGLQLIDVSNTAAPSLLGSFNTPGDAYGVSVFGGVAYASEGYRLQLINVSDPSYPQLVRNYNVTANRAVVSGDFIYVSSSNSLQIINVATIKSSFGTTPWTAAQITAQNNMGYLADTGKNLYLLDISNTSNPTEISGYALSYHATDMIVSELIDNNNKYIYLYVAQSLDGIEVIDVTNNSFPVFAGRITDGITNAKTLQIENNRLYINNDNAEILAFDMTVLHYLNITANKINLVQGTTIITNSNLNIIAVNPLDRATNDIDTIVYAINNLQQGQFTFNNVVVSNFTQAQINSNQIQFTYTGNGTNPSFDFTLNNGNITSGPHTANIYLIRLPQIVLNNIICNEGETVAVTSNDISGIDIDGSYNPNLIFIVDEMGNSQFELTSNPGVIVTQFTQDDVNNNLIQFTPIDSGINAVVTIGDIKPFYQLTVTNGQNQSSINNATIDFDAAPKIIQNQLTVNKGESITITPANLNATDIDNNFLGNLSYQVSNATNGQFEEINNPNIKLANFTQQQINNQQIKFVHDNSDVAPNYKINVTDGRATSQSSSPTVSFNNKEAGINVGLVAGGVIGGIAGLAAAIVGGGFFAKSYIDAITREPHPFANAVHSHLKLSGMDNFKTEQGEKFVRLMEENMAQALLAYGFDIQTMHPNALDDLAKNIAVEAKNKITGSTTSFGYSEIRLNQLENKINDIALALSQYKDLDHIINSSLKKDNKIELTNFVPSFSLRANGLENV